MTTAREDVFANIRRSLGVTGRETPRRSTVDERLAHPRPGIVPRRGQVEGEARLELFKDQAETALASVTVVDDASEVPAEVARHLRGANLPARARLGDDPRLAAMPWAATALEMSQGPSRGDDLVAVSHAYAGVAETGTLALLSGPDNPTTLNFLPDDHVVVVAEGDLAGDLETVIARLRGDHGRGLMPRTVNLITGPSRSGDIEQTMLLGAHGPRRLHVIVVRDGAGEGSPEL